MNINIPALNVVVVPAYSGHTLAMVANLMGVTSPGIDNVLGGGNLNAFIDVVEEVLKAADNQGLSLRLGDREILSWYRDDDREVNPVEPNAEGAPMGARLYVETPDGWVFAVWSSSWYLIPFNETPQERPCDRGAAGQAFSGCRQAAGAIGLMPGTVPGAMLWTPAAEPSQEPAGILFSEDSAPSSDPQSGAGEAGGELPIGLLLVGAAALFFFMD